MCWGPPRTLTYLSLKREEGQENDQQSGGPNSIVTLSWLTRCLSQCVSLTCRFFICKWLDKENMVYIYTVKEYPTINLKKNPAFCNKMDVNGNHYVFWNKPVPKTHIFPWSVIIHTQSKCNLNEQDWNIENWLIFTNLSIILGNSRDSSTYNVLENLYLMQYWVGDCKIKWEYAIVT